MPPESSPDRFTLMAGRMPTDRPGMRTCVTTARNAIRAWAARHGAEPATGQATASGPAVRQVNDGGAGIRFNFPGFAPYRPISWDEWFEHFDQHDLALVFEQEDGEQVQAEAQAHWDARGRPIGDPDADWFAAQQHLFARGGATGGARYAVVKRT